MARNRIIRASFWENESIASLSVWTRLFYISLWNFSDDEGLLSASTSLLKAKSFPYEKNIDINKMLKELQAIKKIEIKGNIIKINNFKVHQKINRPTGSKLKGTFNSYGGTLGRNAGVESASLELAAKAVFNFVNNLYLENKIIVSAFKFRAHQTIITARLRDGYTTEEMNLVAEFKLWENKQHDGFPDHREHLVGFPRKYLTPQTIFRPKHFDTYLQHAKSHLVKT